ncbi:hypothetical protein B7755_045165 [Streptomyces sp. NBS 14/10]|uniref:hypothetical protein n=1 Tax=Streptomyces sp. NBS 14/10 TaxID=1945643 RepID=UPI0015C6357D|nr:hypothetical protein [Streptomyces sp. NBS 14/10]KAK1184646.1 hypothetical protein B7755_045165 [Streptomyces sp. NBS 14/10]NUP44432.1 hypothetical protein [Streptomyces sp.]
MATLPAVTHSDTILITPLADRPSLIDRVAVSICGSAARARRDFNARHGTRTKQV